MFNSLINYVREVRQRRVDIKANGGGLNYAKLLDDAQKARDRLWETPSSCGPVIRYAQKYVYEETLGDFLFKATDVEQEIEDTLRENPHLANTDEGAILNWIQRRDESVTEPIDVPSIWARFQYVANNLIRAGKADIFVGNVSLQLGQIR